MSYDSENTLGHVVYRAAMAFRNTLDLELHRNTVATIQRGKIERDYVVYFLMFARANQGIGMAMLPIAFSIIRDNFPRQKLSIGQGVTSSIFASGAVMGLSVGETGGKPLFYNDPIASSLLMVVSRFIHVTEEQEVRQQELQQLGVETKHKRIEPTGNDKTNGKGERRSVDIKGAATLATAVTSFLLGITYLETGNRR